MFSYRHKFKPMCFTFHYLWSESGLGPTLSETGDSGPLEKVDPTPKFTVWVKNMFWQIQGCWFEIK